MQTAKCPAKSKGVLPSARMSRTGKINQTSYARPTANPFGGDCPHLGRFSSSVDVVMFDSSSVLLKGGFQI